MKLKWLSKNFGLHDPDVLDTLELVLPKYKDILRDNEIKIGFNCTLCSDHKIYAETLYVKDEGFYFVAFGRIENFDLESCVGSGRYTFEGDL